MNERSSERQLTEDDLKQRSLPESALVYLGLSKMTTNPNISKFGIDNLNRMRLNTLKSMDAEDMTALCEYLSWKQSQIRGSGRFKPLTF